MPANPKSAATHTIPEEGLKPSPYRTYEEIQAPRATYPSGPSSGPASALPPVPTSDLPHPTLLDQAIWDRCADARRHPNFLFYPDTQSQHFALIEDLARPEVSFAEVARRNRTTPAALSLWLSRPDISTELAAKKSSIADRAQLIALACLPDAIKSLQATVQKHVQVEQDPYLNSHRLHELDYKRHTRETARKAANLLTRLASAPLPPGGRAGMGLAKISSAPTTTAPTPPVIATPLPNRKSRPASSLLSHRASPLPIQRSEFRVPRFLHSPPMPETTPQGPDSSHRLEHQRRENRDAIAALGLSPYGQRTENILESAAARALYNQEADAAHQANSKTPGFVDPRPVATIAGRVTLLRDNGKLLWIQLRDATGDLQVACSQRDCSEQGFKLAKLTDLGDLLIATGRVMKTKTGEVTIWASDLRPAAKSLVTPPEKHAGLTDVELRYRQRYVDLWSNPETMGVFRLRSRIVSEMRKHLDAQGYLEVETPMLQVLAGGAAARPFVTHMNALSISLFMRIAPELYLKRLMVGGMTKVYEINRNFRNEGLDKQHNPEFTMLELYHAYGDWKTVTDMTEDLIRHLARFVAHSVLSTQDSGLRLPFGDIQIDYGAPFDRITYAALFEKALGFPSTDTTRARAEAKTRHVVSAEAADKLDDVLIINELFERVAEKTLNPGKPTFITEYPAALSPLTRPKPENPLVAERADLFIGGMEVAPHYTELNDPDVQEAKFKEQLKGLDTEKNAEENTFRTMDHDFLRALKVGMPPAGGMGLGIDRLIMLLTNQRTIRDVVLFPLMRPEET